MLYTRHNISADHAVHASTHFPMSASICIVFPFAPIIGHDYSSPLFESNQTNCQYCDVCIMVLCQFNTHKHTTHEAGKNTNYHAVVLVSSTNKYSAIYLFFYQCSLSLRNLINIYIHIIWSPVSHQGVKILSAQDNQNIVQLCFETYFSFGNKLNILQT